MKVTIRGSQTIRTSAVLTDSYVAGTALNCTNAREVVLLVAYTMGASEAANSIQMTLEWSDDGGTTYYHEALPLALEESQTAGSVDIDKTVLSYGADSVAATYDYLAIPIKVLADLLKVSVKETGRASNFGTCAIKASMIDY